LRSGEVERLRRKGKLKRGNREVEGLRGQDKGRKFEQLSRIAQCVILFAMSATEIIEQFKALPPE
jgi:dsDNA-specific endonuclease/ATPase MutS2